jgi:hypothetical protein
MKNKHFRREILYKYVIFKSTKIYEVSLMYVCVCVHICLSVYSDLVVIL